MDELDFRREFLRVARWAADRPAFRDSQTGSSVTFAEHRERVGQVSSMLATLGVGHDDRYSTLLDSRATYAELWHAGLCGAGIINSLNSRTNPDELAYILADSAARVAFVSAEFAALVDQVRRRVPTLEQVVLVGGGDVPHDLVYEDLLASADDVMPDPPRESDPCTLLYTGGTTGLPRGVLLDQRALMLNWRRSVEVLRPDPRWHFLQVVPMAHVAALMSLTKVHLAGATITVMPNWDAGRALEIIDSEQIGALSVVPTMAVQLLEHPDFRPERLRSLRYVGYGTAPMPLGLLQRLLAVLPADCSVCQSYGMTESCGTVTMLGADEHRLGDETLLKSAGRPLAGVAVSIRDPLGDELAPGQTGEIWLQCGSIMREYWHQPEETARALDGGWYHTGDMGYADARGYLWVTDRLKDMIVTGGENVYSIEVENAISTLTGVVRVAVFGTPHPLWGEAVNAVVQVSADSDLTEAQVLDHASARLARLKVPKQVQLTRAALPVSPTGKILKRELRSQWAATEA